MSVKSINQTVWECDGCQRPVTTSPFDQGPDKFEDWVVVNYKSMRKEDRGNTWVTPNYMHTLHYCGVCASKKGYKLE